jgi:hypothetical protein
MPVNPAAGPGVFHPHGAGQLPEISQGQRGLDQKIFLCPASHPGDELEKAFPDNADQGMENRTEEGLRWQRTVIPLMNFMIYFVDSLTMR